MKPGDINYDDNRCVVFVVRAFPDEVTDSADKKFYELSKKCVDKQDIIGDILTGRYEDRSKIYGLSSDRSECFSRW